MELTNSISRRQFVAAASGAMLAGTLNGVAGEAAAPATAEAKLAINGGEKAIKTPAVLKDRWGEPERERLEAMLRQDTLFFWKGPQTELMMERFRKACPSKYVQTCSSGTAAVHIAVGSCGIGLGDEVITSPMTDPGTVIGVIYQQGVPVFADLVPGTYNLDPADVQRKITPKTKAIVAVHLFGNPCNLEPLKAVADRHRLPLIEDCCQAWGAKYRGKPIGTIGDFACYSLQISKLITCGEGGIVGSNHELFGPLLLRFADKGFDRRDPRESLKLFSTNYRMSETQAAVAAAQLERLEGIAAKRSRLGRLLNEKIGSISGILPQAVHPEDRCVHWYYTFRVQPKAFRCTRDEFVKALVAEGLHATAGYWRGPLYTEHVFREHSFFAGRWPVREMGLTNMDYTKWRCPNAEEVHATAVILPLHEGMDEEYILAVAGGVEKVARYYAGNG